MIITDFISSIAGIATIIGTVIAVTLYILTTKKTTIILTFSNGKDKIECKVGVDTTLHFLLKNTGNVAAHSVEALIYYPKGLRPRTRDNTQPEKVEYLMNPERMVLRVENLPSRSNSPTRHTSSVKPNKPNTFEFEYEITGEKVKNKKGKLLLEAKS